MKESIFFIIHRLSMEKDLEINVAVYTGFST